MVKSLKVFGIAFLISAVLLGIVAAVLMGMLDDVLTGSFNKHDSEIAEILNGGGDDTGEGEGSQTSVKNDLSDIPGSTFSILAVMTDYRPDVYDYSMKNKDGVGIFQAVGHLIASHLHDRGYHLRVGHVHLAPIRLYI